MTEVQYIKLIEREVKRAAAFGQTGVIVLSDYTFSCGSLGTLILLGKLSGPLMKYYKGLKTDRKTEKDFAKGICYFQEVEGQPPIMRIALNDGKGRPAKMKKNGKKLFKKLGFAVDIFKGDLGLQKVGLEAKEIDQIEAEVEQENDDQKMIIIIRAYKKTFALVANHVIPILKAKTPKKIEERHYQLSLRLLKLSKSLEDKLAEISEQKQQKYCAFVAEAKAKEPRLIKIVAKLKQHLKNRTVEGNLDEVRGELHYANHARRYGVDEEIVFRLIAARAEASKFHEEISKTDKYKKEIQTKKELSDKNIAFGQDLQLNKTYLLSNTFGIYSKEESRYEKEFGGIFLDSFQAKIKEMARRIATTKATQLIFRATFRHSYNEGTVKEVCQKLTTRLNNQLKELKGKDFQPISYVLNEVKRAQSKDMAGYFVLLKE